MPNSLLDKLNLELAFDRVIEDSKSDPIIIKFDVEIAKVVRAKLVKTLEDKIKLVEANRLLGENCVYEPSPLKIMDRPKKDGTLRPGIICEIRDRIYYQALCDSIASVVDEKLYPYGEKIVFSYRLDPSATNSQMFRKTNDSYEDFISHQMNLLNGNEYNYILETDISSYYERIYQHKLIQLLQGFGCDSLVVSAISALLRKWSQGISYGIPQDIGPSHLLGNSYLHTLDVYMISENYKYFRYLDDIRVFCKTEIEGKKALAMITKEIRPLGLNLNSGKTRIVDKNCQLLKLKPFSQKLEEMRELTQQVNIIYEPYFDEFNIDSRPNLNDVEVKSIISLFESVIIDDPIDEKAIRFCLAHLFSVYQRGAIDFCLDNIRHRPHLSSQFINYLGSLDYDPDICIKILNFLKSEYNIYDWQEMWLLKYFFKVPDLFIELKTYLKTVSSNRNKHSINRATALLILGKFGDYAELRLIKDMFGTEESLYIKRAIILALQKLPKAERNHAYKYWASQDISLYLAVEYVNQKEELLDVQGAS